MWKAVVFDFDGLIVDTEFPAYTAWSKIYQRYGATLRLEDWVKCVGGSNRLFDPAIHLVKLSGVSLDAAQLLEEKNELKRAIVATQPILLGVKERLEEARKAQVPVGLASSSSAEWVFEQLERLSLTKSFKVIRTAADVSRVKPHPDLYLAAAEALGVKSAGCLVFEDSRNGLLAAKSAGMSCIVVPNQVTKISDFTEADMIWNSLKEHTLAAAWAELSRK